MFHPHASPVATQPNLAYMRSMPPSSAPPIISVSGLSKTYDSGFSALKTVDLDIRRGYRAARAAIGLVPQELTTDAFETVWGTVNFSRGLFGKPKDPGRIEHILKDLSLWDKRDSQIRMLSGGMKRRVMIAKALSHEPRILFLDEPTAGVDVELRQDMWNTVRDL